MHQRYDAQRQSIIDSVRSNHPLRVSTLIIPLWWYSSTISYSSCIPSHSFWHQRCYHCFVGWPASSYLTNPGRSTPSCPYASGFSCCVHPISQVFGHTRGVAQRKDGPLYLTSSVWVGDHGTKDTWVSIHSYTTGYPPTKLHLLLLDAFILLLQIILTTISYEKSLHLSSPSTIPDALLPTPASLVAFPSSGSSMENETTKRSHHESPWIIDLRLRHIISRLHEPAPLTPETHVTLPLPNTTPLPIPFHLRAIMRRRVHREDDMVDTENPGRGLPGGMGVDDI